MKRFIKNIYIRMVYFGIDPRQTITSIMGIPLYLRDLRKLKFQQKVSDISIPFSKSVPCLGDKFSESGVAKGHYFHQDLLVARRIFINKPELHVDIGSRIDGFVAHVASYREIEVLDIRALTSNIPNVKFSRADLMADLDESLVDYCDSLSCLHTVEHLGLGRYGDPVKWDGYLTGFDNLYKVLKKNGKFYFSVPIGPMRIEFNAHRVFSVEYLLGLFDGKYSIDMFSYVDDKGDLYEDVKLTKNELADNFGCFFGCGIFEMTKI